jgi:thiol-disulfide isomerase/thioredoxin
VKIQYWFVFLAVLGLVALAAGRRRRSLRFAGGATLVFLLGFAAGYFTYEPYTRYVWRSYYKRITQRFQGKPAPNVTSVTLDGKPWKLGDELGRVVVLDFWASWCSPCERVIPALKAAQAAYGSRGDFRIVGIALDEHCSSAMESAKQQGMTWMNTCESKSFDNGVARAFGVNSLPSLWLVDREGRIQGVRVDERQLGSHLEQMLGRGTAGDSPIKNGNRPSNNRVKLTVQPVTSVACATAAPARPAAYAGR